MNPTLYVCVQSELGGDIVVLKGGCLLPSIRMLGNRGRDVFAYMAAAIAGISVFAPNVEENLFRWDSIQEVLKSR